MTKFEIISSLVSLLAVVVSFYSLYRSKRNHDQLIEIEKVHAKLSERELAEYDKRDRDAQKAILSVRMVKEGKVHKFVITNQGEAEAKNIYFGLEQDNEHNPLVPNDFEQKSPYRILGQATATTCWPLFRLVSDRTLTQYLFAGTMRMAVKIVSFGAWLGKI